MVNWTRSNISLRTRIDHTSEGAHLQIKSLNSGEMMLILANSSSFWRIPLWWSFKFNTQWSTNNFQYSNFLGLEIVNWVLIIGNYFTSKWPFFGFVKMTRSASAENIVLRPYAGLPRSFHPTLNRGSLPPSHLALMFVLIDLIDRRLLCARVRFAAC